VSLLADIAAQEPIKGPRCSVAILLDTLDAQDASDLVAALANPTYQGTSISRALKGRGINLAPHSIVRHRRGDCLCR
jgi:hypothetical protein